MYYIKNNVIDSKDGVSFLNFFFVHGIRNIEKKKKKNQVVGFLKNNYLKFFEKIIGNEHVKLGLILSLIGGSDSFNFRKDIHLLIKGRSQTGKCIGPDQKIKIKIGEKIYSEEIRKIYEKIKFKNERLFVESFCLKTNKVEFRLIESVSKDLVKGVLRFELEFGNIICSQDHKLYDPVTSEFKMASIFREGENLMDNSGKKIKILKITRESKRDYFFDIQVEGNRNYFFGGILGHNSLILKDLERMQIGELISGEGSSKAGLTTSSLKDEYSNSFYFAPGTFIKNNLGTIFLDDFQNLDSSAQSILFSVLEKQTISISKGGRKQVFNCRFTLIASYSSESKKIYLPEPLLNRFDLILEMKPIYSEKELKEFIIHKINQVNGFFSEELSSFESEFINVLEYVKGLKFEFIPKLNEVFKLNLFEILSEKKIEINIRTMDSLKRIVVAYCKLNEVKILSNRRMKFILNWFFRNNVLFQEKFYSGEEKVEKSEKLA